MTESAQIGAGSGSPAPPHQSRRGLLFDVVATLGTRLGGLGLGLVTSVVIARTLGPEGRGLFAVAVTISAVGVQFGNLGLHAGNTYAVVRDQANLGAAIANSLIVSLGLGSLISLLTLLLFALYPRIAPLPMPLLAIGLAMVPAGLAALLLQQLLVAAGRVGRFNLTELTSRGFMLSGSLLLIANGLAEPVWVALSALLSSLAIVTISLITLARRNWRSIRASRDLFWRQLPYGLKAYVGALVSFLVLRIDLLIVQYILGPTAAGEYSVAVALADIVYLLPVTVGLLLFPKLTSEPDDRVRRREAIGVARWVAAVMTLATIAGVTMGSLAITALYGPEYAGSVAAFTWLMPGIAFLSIHTILMNYFAAVGMPMIVLVAPVIGLAVNLGTNAVLIHPFGIVGVSIASTVAYGAMLTVAAGYFVTTGKRPPDDQLHAQFSRGP